MLVEFVIVVFICCDMYVEFFVVDVVVYMVVFLVVGVIIEVLKIRLKNFWICLLSWVMVFVLDGLIMGWLILGKKLYWGNVLWIDWLCENFLLEFVLMSLFIFFCDSLFGCLRLVVWSLSGENMLIVNKVFL